MTTALKQKPTSFTPGGVTYPLKGFNGDLHEVIDKGCEPNVASPLNNASTALSLKSEANNLSVT